MVTATGYYVLTTDNKPVFVIVTSAAAAVESTDHVTALFAKPVVVTTADSCKD